MAFDGTKATFGQLLVRNTVRFLPWEMAHFFAFHLTYYTRNNIEPPGWIMAGLVAVQGLAVLYLLSIFSKTNRDLYDKLSATKTIFS